MKSIFLQILFTFMAMVGLSQPVLHWKFDNINHSFTGGYCFFQFDVMLSCTQTGTYHSSMQIYFDYNTAAFGEYIVSNGNILVEKLELMNGMFSGSDKYNLLPPATPGVDIGPGRYAIFTEAMIVFGNPVFMNEVPLFPEFKGFLRFTITVQNINEVAGIEFVETMMNSGQYYVALGGNVETKYGIPPLYSGIYENNLLNCPVYCDSGGFGVNLTVFLEGPFNGSVMNTTLNALLPLSQPYHTPLPYFGNPDPKWYYTGPEAVTFIPGTDIVDWIYLEVRDAPVASAATSATTIGKKAVFLRNDGHIVDLDGYSNPVFPVLISQGCFVVIFHRNHLAVMNANPIIPASYLYTYNFSTGAEQVYGGSLGHKDIGGGKWGMVASDGNADGQISSPDKIDVWTLLSGASGYTAGDFNLDGQVNNPDKILFWIPNSGSGTQVPDGIIPPGGYVSRVP